METVFAGELVSDLHNAGRLPANDVSFCGESPLNPGSDCGLISFKTDLVGGVGIMDLLFICIVSFHRAV